MAGIAISAVARPRALRTGIAVALGAALFAVRPYTSLDPYSAPWLLALIYVALLIVSVGPVVRDASPQAGWALPLVTGIAAVGAMRLVLRPVTPPDPRVVVAVLGAMAAVAEEAYFRRLLYSAFERYGTMIAIAGSAAVFALMHYPSYGWPALPLDFGAGLLFGWQRWASGSWAVPAATHACANLLSSI